MLTNYLKIAWQDRRRNFIPTLLGLALFALGLIACSMNVLHSDLTVQAGNQFELGGNQQGAFVVQVKNVGVVPVTISERQADGQQPIRGTFQPGDAQTVRFSPGSAAIVDNQSGQSARLDLVVTGDNGNLRMQEINKP